jgi:hypothetical protein
VRHCWGKELFVVRRIMVLAGGWFCLQCAQSVKVKYRRRRAVIRLMTVKRMHGEHMQMMEGLTQFNAWVGN